MTKSKTKTQKSGGLPVIMPAHLPTAPWIYLDDPTGSCASHLATLIPLTCQYALTGGPNSIPDTLAAIDVKANRNKVIIFSYHRVGSGPFSKKADAQTLKEAAIKNGCNFASINLRNPGDGRPKTQWGTNHLDLSLTPDSVIWEETMEIAEQIYKWLFSVFSVLEHLHLIPDAQMQEYDRGPAFKDYKYCPISESRSQPRDAKIQFVALVVSKPVVRAQNHVSWQVADKTGTANFYFTYRGVASQYTWDWVLALKPGDRKCLPRMSMVPIKEHALATVLKAPVRVTGAVVGGAGCVIQAAGTGLRKVGKKMKMGKRTTWVKTGDLPKSHESTVDSKDTKDEKKVVVVPPSPKAGIKVFTEKGEKTWTDTDSVASTTAGSADDEKISPLE